MTIIEQDSEIINRLSRSYDYKSKSNNWLKFHGRIMRRKPFKRSVMILDEFWNISNNIRKLTN